MGKQSKSVSVSNVDQQEIARFADLASRWWDPHGEMRPLHALNPARLGYVQNHIDLDGRDVVDIGCGGGLLTEALSGAGAKAIGIDAGDKVVAIAKLHALESGSSARYEVATAEAFAEQHAEQFDLVTCMEMLEHVPDPGSVIAACERLLKPGGWLFLSTINRSPAAFAGAIVAAEYVLKLLPRGTHEYAKFLKPSELAEWLRTSDLRLVDVSGLHYNPISDQASVGGAPTVNYLLAARKGS